MSNEELIILKQKPIIEYSQMEARGLEVAERIKLMNIDTIEPNEANRSIMKSMRAEINKELSLFEDKRKMVHAAVTQPYKLFTMSYEKNIKSRYVTASEMLKSKISSVEEIMLKEKTSDTEAYFKDKKGDLDFLELKKIGLNIIISATTKKLHDQIDVFIAKVENELASIHAMSDSIRIESLYKTNLDLSLSVSTVLADIKRENEETEKRAKKEALDKKEEEKRAEQERLSAEQEAKDRVSRKKLEAEEVERNVKRAKDNAERNKSEEAEAELERREAEQVRASEALELAEKERKRFEDEESARQEKKTEQDKIWTMKFTASGTAGQLKEVKQFMKKIGVNYE